MKSTLYQCLHLSDLVPGTVGFRLSAHSIILTVYLWLVPGTKIWISKSGSKNVDINI